MSRSAYRRPTRTCTGCRERGDKAELIRVVATDGVLVVDPKQDLPGRGAYLHRSESCLDRALKRRAIGRALRTSVDSDQVDAALRSITGQGSRPHEADDRRRGGVSGGEQPSL